ncbi:2-aminoethylphosphonate--pyruvate aminotransferase [Kiloniella spongiae]|uniref:2-aminoethylphosphonate--pyruvate transaminase n=1 Tax=Kiloniella spongiae TaxID=1489064 RepID=A0A0H2MC49_9PROT|nr:2-aminoethylphosphonate--pyruvate transaminase [Kiloniella spongiae]KLN60119.1 2-aminoethylphosphonate--pyruvate aminotransferase [Kiloniella spongiae]
MSDKASAVAASPSGDPWLLTPGPLTTSVATKEAMLHDFGSRDKKFIEINRRVRSSLLNIINGQDDFVCVPLQGSGTFSVEAMLGTLVPQDGKLLILVNGAYGHRMAKICSYYGRAHDVMEYPEDQPVSISDLDARLGEDKAVTHVAVIHCETTSGVLNPIAGVAEVVEKHGRSLLIDSMSAFGALPVDASKIKYDAVAASSNKCLEGVPGMGFVLIRRTVLEKAKGNAPSLVLDLYDQWVQMEKTDQWRFTPPTHCIVAFEQAIREYEEEGGVEGRGGRYASNCKILVDGMRALGFETLLPDHLQAPIIVTFHKPTDPKFDFQNFYDRLAERGYLIYPGKLTVADSFRVGCIGRMGNDDIRDALVVIEETLNEMGVENCAPAAA